MSTTTTSTPLTRAQKAMTTTRERALTLWQDGYRLDPLPHAPGCFIVTTPARINRETGEVFVVDYTVDALAGTCNCEMFAQNGVCKHQLAVEARIEEARRLVMALGPVPDTRSERRDDTRSRSTGRERIETTDYSGKHYASAGEAMQARAAKDF